MEKNTSAGFDEESAERVVKALTEADAQVRMMTMALFAIWQQLHEQPEIQRNAWALFVAAGETTDRLRKTLETMPDGLRQKVAPVSHVAVGGMKH